MVSECGGLPVPQYRPDQWLPSLAQTKRPRCNSSAACFSCVWLPNRSQVDQLSHSPRNIKLPLGGGLLLEELVDKEWACGGEEGGGS